MRITLPDAVFHLIDVQERLTPMVSGHKKVVSQLALLIQGMQALDVPIVVSEQYKKGLGETVEPLKTLLSESPHFEKVTFSGCDDAPTLAHLQQHNKKFVIIGGIETHVCIMQTALDLLAADLQPVIVCDAVSSRSRKNHKIALQRLQQAGAVLTTVESILFELCRSSKSPAFKTISNLVK